MKVESATDEELVVNLLKLLFFAMLVISAILSKVLHWVTQRIVGIRVKYSVFPPVRMFLFFVFSVFLIRKYKKISEEETYFWKLLKESYKEFGEDLGPLSKNMFRRLDDLLFKNQECKKKFFLVYNFLSSIGYKNSLYKKRGDYEKFSDIRKHRFDKRRFKSGLGITLTQYSISIQNRGVK